METKRFEFEHTNHRHRHALGQFSEAKVTEKSSVARWFLMVFALSPVRRAWLQCCDAGVISKVLFEFA